MSYENIPTQKKGIDQPQFVAYSIDFAEGSSTLQYIDSAVFVFEFMYLFELNSNFFFFF